VARPVLDRILVERYSPRRLLGEFRKRLPELVTQAPDMPRLLHAWLTQQVEGRQQLHMHSKELSDIAVAMRLLQRRAVGAIVGAGLLITASVLYALEAGGPRVAGVPLSAWVAGIGGAWALLAAWPRR
jgi:ubiquinone biosynthesis protein